MTDNFHFIQLYLTSDTILPQITTIETGFTKSEALKQAQVALITGDYEAVLGGNRGVAVRERLEESVSSDIRGKLDHPYYWAPFILIGNGL